MSDILFTGDSSQQMRATVKYPFNGSEMLGGDISESTQRTARDAWIFSNQALDLMRDFRPCLKNNIDILRVFGRPSITDAAQESGSPPYVPTRKEVPDQRVRDAARFEKDQDSDSVISGKKLEDLIADKLLKDLADPKKFAETLKAMVDAFDDEAGATAVKAVIQSLKNKTGMDVTLGTKGIAFTHRPAGADQIQTTMTITIGDDGKVHAHESRSGGISGNSTEPKEISVDRALEFINKKK